jgi:hypothetical protein
MPKTPVMGLCGGLSYFPQKIWAAGTWMWQEHRHGRGTTDRCGAWLEQWTGGRQAGAEQDGGGHAITRWSIITTNSEVSLLCCSAKPQIKISTDERYCHGHGTFSMISRIKLDGIRHVSRGGGAWK